MVTTNDSELAERMNQMRNHGASVSEEQRHHGPRPWILADSDLLGYNYRMTDLQGAVGVVQLGKLDAFIDERARWAQFYREQLADIDWLRLPETPANARHGWQSFVTWVDSEKAPMPRNDMMQLLQEHGIATRPGTHAVHMLGLYRQQYGFQPEDFPGARDCNDCTMAIPLHNRMTEDDYHYVVQAIRIVGR
jgi:dTDP-4-amino-4,6-dideoxygalactose transaminase